MQKMKLHNLLIIGVLLSGCSSPSAGLSTPTVAPPSQPPATPTSMETPVPTSTSQPPSPLFSLPNTYGEGIGIFSSAAEDYDVFNIESLDVHLLRRFGRYRDSNYMVFANHSPFVAFWLPGDPGQILVADMQFREVVTIFADVENRLGEYVYPLMAIRWTPDDMHVIIDMLDPQSEDYIYHLESNTTEPWGFSCDTVARSPRTGLYTLWCPSHIPDENRIRVLEWGGEIWETDEYPEDVLVSRGVEDDIPGRFPIWAWSADGEKIAYFDSAQPNAPLVVVTTDGKVSISFEVYGYWLTDYYQTFRLRDTPIEWSHDGSRVLVMAIGPAQTACPDITIPEGPYAATYKNPACWRIVDLLEGREVWNAGDAPSILNISNHTECSRATISPDGAHVAMSCYSLDFSMPILTIIRVSDYARIINSTAFGDAIQWVPGY